MGWDSEEVIDSVAGFVGEHVRRYVTSGGTDGHDFHGTPTLLLTTHGRRSGRLRRTALIYGRDGDRYVVVGSNSGTDVQPAWLASVRAHPDVTVEAAGETFRARATITEGAERRRLLDAHQAAIPIFKKYEAMTARELPVVALERRPDS